VARPVAGGRRRVSALALLLPLVIGAHHQNLPLDLVSLSESLSGRPDGARAAGRSLMTTNLLALVGGGELGACFREGASARAADANAPAGRLRAGRRRHPSCGGAANADGGHHIRDEQANQSINMRGRPRPGRRARSRPSSSRFGPGGRRRSRKVDAHPQGVGPAAARLPRRHETPVSSPRAPEDHAAHPINQVFNAPPAEHVLGGRPNVSNCKSRATLCEQPGRLARAL
jgi:hypothetical protein